MIRLRFTAPGSTGPAREYDTDSLNVALHGFVDDHIKDPRATGTDDSNGPEAWLFAIVIERNGATLSTEKLLDDLKVLRGLEEYRAERRATVTNDPARDS